MEQKNIYDPNLKVVELGEQKKCYMCDAKIEVGERCWFEEPDRFFCFGCGGEP